MKTREEAKEKKVVKRQDQNLKENTRKPKKVKIESMVKSQDREIGDELIRNPETIHGEHTPGKRLLKVFSFILIYNNC